MEPAVIEKASRVRRFQIAATGAAVVTITTALIACAGPAGASPARPPRGEVICQTLTPGSGDLYVLGSCSDKAQTGGSGNIDLTKLVYGGGTDHHIKIAWASGKVTVFTDSVQESLGACGMQYDEFWEMQGSVVKDTTGKITAPMDIELCGPEPSWILENAQL